MEDIFILEDDFFSQEIMTEQIPEGLTFKLATNGAEFEKYLAKGSKAKLYFLDDVVPDAIGKMGFHFIKHCSHLLERLPEAKIFYTGSMPSKEKEMYCQKHNISMLDEKNNIGAVIRRELGK